MSRVDRYDEPYLRQPARSRKICKRAPRPASSPTFKPAATSRQALTDLFIKVASSTASLTQ